MNNDTQGLIGGIQRFSTSDGPGIRTTVFFKGCPLNCAWCHNPELINVKQQLMRSDTKCIGCGVCAEHCSTGAIVIEEGRFCIDRDLCNECFECVSICSAEALSTAGEWQSVNDVMKIILKDKGYYEKSGGGVTLSGGEILNQASFAEKLIDAAALENITVALDTCGFGSEKALRNLARKADYVLFDMKCILDKGHKKYTGHSNKRILDNLETLAADSEIKDKVNARMPLIRGINDTNEVITATCTFYKKNNINAVTLLPYHELGLNKSRGIGRDAQTFSAPDHERLLEIKDLFCSNGMTVEILGEDIA